MKIYAYKNSSESAKALANALGVKRLKHEGKMIVYETILNWGSSHMGRDWDDCDWINNPLAVSMAVNKLRAFHYFKFDGVAHPQFTESLVEASEWLAGGDWVVARTKLNGHSGEGIVLCAPGDDLPDAPLYTKYIKKSEEYRVHVHDGVAFFVQRKARRLDVPKEKVNWKIRNHANGFIFAHKDLQYPEAIITESIKAVQSLCLDFGAVDVMVDHDGNPFVLEVNTACGLEGTTLEKYVEQFRRYL